MVASHSFLSVCKETDHRGSPVIKRYVYQFEVHADSTDVCVLLEHWNGKPMQFEKVAVIAGSSLLAKKNSLL